MISLHLFSLRKKPLTALIEFTPGLGEIVRDEIESILRDPWIPEKTATKTPKLHIYPEKIIIHKISIQSLLGIALRSYTVKDIFIQISETWNVSEVPQFDPDPLLKNWMTTHLFSLKSIIRKNPKLDEEEYRKNIYSRLTSILESEKTSIQSSNQSNRPARLLVSIMENKATLFIGLRDEPIYRRNFRIPLPASYPLAEDTASSLLHVLKKICLQVETKTNFNHKIYTIPFCGTGTLGWEAFFQESQIYPGSISLRMDFLVEAIGRQNEWDHLYKKAISSSYRTLPSEASSIEYFMSDRDGKTIFNTRANLTSLYSKLHQHSLVENTKFTDINISIEEEDFFSSTPWKNWKDHSLIQLPLHPPYGIRSGRKENSRSFFGRIAKKVLEFKHHLTRHSSIIGFILLPDAAALSAVTDAWKQEMEWELVHFSQGKLPIRALFFWHSIEKNP